MWRAGNLTFAGLAKVVSLAAIAALASTQAAHPQEWPQRPVKIVVPYAPGGNADSVARLVAQHLGEAFGQPFVVENRPGATGAIAAEAVARSPADGYTLLLASLPQIAIMPAVVKTSFDPRKDAVPISAMTTSPLVLVVHASVPVKSIAELVAFARNRPGELTYAAAGFGSMTHLAMALFLQRAGIEMIPVMYKGGSSTMADVVAGHVKAYFLNISGAVPYATGGMVRLLAVSSAQRVPQIPDVPTMVESGYPGVQGAQLDGPHGTRRNAEADH